MVTINLSSVNVGFGPGVIPATYTVYARAKAHYSGPAVPGADTQFIFSTSAVASSDNVGADG